ncbi:hypothetical protein VP01_1581g1 [Puccinia sorghi]|uniref:Uncharacterized protein n=1 Tax=Puccinia sorghi TaxID=27349 RepID=A0A0L6VHM5_9BASI|nr:hypothetical protein VP01_1581g1 [Puccinia sorghi]
MMSKKGGIPKTSEVLVEASKKRGMVEREMNMVFLLIPQTSQVQGRGWEKFAGGVGGEKRKKEKKNVVLREIGYLFNLCKRDEDSPMDVKHEGGGRGWKRMSEEGLVNMTWRVTGGGGFHLVLLHLRISDKKRQRKTGCGGGGGDLFGWMKVVAADEKKTQVRLRRTWIGRLPRREREIERRKRVVATGIQVMWCYYSVRYYSITLILRIWLYRKSQVVSFFFFLYEGIVRKTSGYNESWSDDVSQSHTYKFTPTPDDQTMYTLTHKNIYMSVGRAKAYINYMGVCIFLHAIQYNITCQVRYQDKSDSEQEWSRSQQVGLSCNTWMVQLHLHVFMLSETLYRHHTQVYTPFNKTTHPTLPARGFGAKILEEDYVANEGKIMTRTDILVSGNEPSLEGPLHRGRGDAGKWFLIGPPYQTTSHQRILILGSQRYASIVLYSIHLKSLFYLFIYLLVLHTKHLFFFPTKKPFRKMCNFFFLIATLKEAFYIWRPNDGPPAFVVSRRQVTTNSARPASTVSESKKKKGLRQLTTIRRRTVTAHGDYLYSPSQEVPAGRFQEDLIQSHAAALHIVLRTPSEPVSPKAVWVIELITRTGGRSKKEKKGRASFKAPNISPTYVVHNSGSFQVWGLGDLWIFKSEILLSFHERSREPFLTNLIKEAAWSTLRGRHHRRPLRSVSASWEILIPVCKCTNFMLLTTYCSGSLCVRQLLAHDSLRDIKLVWAYRCIRPNRGKLLLYLVNSVIVRKKKKRKRRDELSFQHKVPPHADTHSNDIMLCRI